MTVPFPSPTIAIASRAEVFLGYLDFYRASILAKLDGLPESELRGSRLPSGWTPLQLLKHVTYVERRWLEWGFEGADVDDPWGDGRDDRWYVDPGEATADLVAAFEAQAATTRAIVLRHDLSERGRPSERWEGEDPPPLERVLFHLLQEYARHAGHLDIVRELVDGTTGE
jgi:uncharacterized damage-inducible protein DinB